MRVAGCSLTAVYAARFKDNVLVIAIEGARDWTLLRFLDETQVSPAGVVPMPLDHDARVRRGNSWFAATIKTELADYVREQVNGGVRDIIVVGHSQGGSVAEILGVAYQMQYPTLGVAVRAFNPPRTGNFDWATLVEQKLGQRFGFAVRTNDEVSQKPGREGTPKWAHPVGEVYLPVGAGEDGWLTCPGRENPKCLRGYKGDLARAAPGDPYVH